MNFCRWPANIRPSWYGRWWPPGPNGGRFEMNGRRPDFVWADGGAALSFDEFLPLASQHSAELVRALVAAWARRRAV